MFNFNGKTVLITAASRGLGLEIATQFGCLGARIIAVAKDPIGLDHLKDHLDSTSYPTENHLFIAQDLSLRSSPELLANKMLSSGIIPDVVIHNLGGTLKVKSFQSPFEDIQNVLWLNATFAITLNNFLIPHLHSKDFARIIHVSSISSKTLRGSGPYAAAKAYLDAYTVCISRELATSKILVCGIRPGAFFTERGDWAINLTQRPEMVKDFLRHHHASQRLGTPNDIVPFILFLASKYSSWAIGTLIDIDGGTM
jgi:3-oxoacyl-[acyl-carrier protein] reductase